MQYIKISLTFPKALLRNERINSNTHVYRICMHRYMVFVHIYIYTHIIYIDTQMDGGK